MILLSRQFGRAIKNVCILICALLAADVVNGTMFDRLGVEAVCHPHCQNYCRNIVETICHPHSRNNAVLNIIFNSDFTE